MSVNYCSPCAIAVSCAANTPRRCELRRGRRQLQGRRGKWGGSAVSGQHHEGGPSLVDAEGLGHGRDVTAVLESPEPASPSGGLGFTRWLLPQRAGSLGDVVRGERGYVGTVELIHTPVLVARQPQRLAVERLLE